METTNIAKDFIVAHCYHLARIASDRRRIDYTTQDPEYTEYKCRTNRRVAGFEGAVGC